MSEKTVRKAEHTGNSVIDPSASQSAVESCCSDGVGFSRSSRRPPIHDDSRPVEPLVSVRISSGCAEGRNGIRARMERATPRQTTSAETATVRIDGESGRSMPKTGSTVLSATARRATTGRLAPTE